jgi:hypothetical protein
MTLVSWYRCRPALDAWRARKKVLLEIGVRWVEMGGDRRAMQNAKCGMKNAEGWERQVTGVARVTWLHERRGEDTTPYLACGSRGRSPHLWGEGRNWSQWVAVGRSGSQQVAGQG